MPALVSSLLILVTATPVQQPIEPLRRPTHLRTNYALPHPLSFAFSLTKEYLLADSTYWAILCPKPGNANLQVGVFALQGDPLVAQVLSLQYLRVAGHSFLLSANVSHLESTLTQKKGEGANYC